MLAMPPHLPRTPETLTPSPLSLPSTPSTPTTPPPLPRTPIPTFAIPASATAPCISRSASAPHCANAETAFASSTAAIDYDSGKSSCSPALLDCSFDSGIGVDANAGSGSSATACNSSDMQLRKRIHQCRRILSALERDKEGFRLLRERLCKIVDKKNKKDAPPDDEQICNVCCAEIDATNVKAFVICCTCHKHICRSSSSGGVEKENKCADWLPATAQWECQLCHTSKESLAHTSSWVAEQMSFNQQKYVYPMRARSEIYIPISDCNDSSMHFESVSQIGATSAAISAEQKLKIREYVEEVVASMLGGSLENISVAQISKSENYLPTVLNGHHNAANASTPNNNNNNNNIQNGNHNDFADISHTRLRQLIEAIIGETLRLPVLSSANSAVSEISLDTRSRHNALGANGLPLTNGNGVVRRHRTEHYFEPKVYQDLLATAVLNKIVDKQSNSNRPYSESTPDLSSRRMVDPNFNEVENESTTSGSSSIEPRSEFSYTDAEQALNFSKVDEHSQRDSQRNAYADDELTTAGRESALSDYIAAHMVPLPDLSAPPTESEEDDYLSVTSSTIGEGTWEDNWLFKKKRHSALNITAAAGNVGMLVPAPKEDVRAQIGDRTADEVSDLSEMGSDTDENSSLDIIRSNLDPLNDRLLNKHLIGGQNTKMVLDELVDRASMISQTIPAPDEPTYTETRNKHVVEAATKTEAINTEVTQMHTQAVDVAVAEISLLPPPADFGDSLEAEADSAPNPLSGSIAEREYKKWNNAVEMPNNPYAPDALKRRISGSRERFIDLPNISPSTEQNPLADIQNIHDEVDAEEQNRESDYKRYSRDYYINEAKPTTTTSSPKRQTSNSAAGTVSALISDDPTTDNIIINEVIPNGVNTTPRPSNTSTNSIDRSDCHWTLSTPVRRSSSLKFINNRTSPLSCYSTNHQQTSQPFPRSSTSASHYDDDDYADDNNDDDIRSQRSWKSAITTNLSTLPKRRTLSSLSFNSSASGVSLKSAASTSTAKSRRSQPSAQILSQFEKQLLHKDLKRNSFRAISATTKDFVVNPIYDREQFYGVDGKPKLSLRPADVAAGEDQGDSGVDSCLNGFSEADAKNSNTSLLF